VFHLFYWGHATSPDLVHWTHQPRALSDVMSGSVVIDRQNTSGFGTADNPPWVAVFSLLDDETLIQTQGLAYSIDSGITWTKYDENPVIDIGSTEFRDPQVFWYEPDERWIMVVALAEEHKVRFYASDNLKDWTHLSDFGPAGATRGVWECPDLFPLPIDGDSTNLMWVLEVDVQPIGGQYFVGDFDGTSFHLDSTFARGLSPSDDPPPSGRVLFDFEDETYGDWTVDGTAFDDGPTRGALSRQTPVINFEGSGLVSSFHGGDQPTGTMTSPSFTIDRPFVSFKIGGGDRPRKTGVHLLVDGEIVRVATGRNMETLHWRSWEVRDLEGASARIQIVDRASGGWGHINVDHIMLSDAPARTEREDAFWIDYGMDFYAVRSWHDMPSTDDRRIWIAWMGNWRYADLVPTEGWTGVQSLPRTLSLVSTPEGPRLVQQPVRELQKLRQQPFTLSGTRVDGTLDLTGEHGVTARSAEIIATFVPEDADVFGLRVRKGADEQTEIGYRMSEQEVYVDRRRSGAVSFSQSFPGVHAGPLRLREDGTVQLRIFVDRSTVEVFGNGGRTVISDGIFPSFSSTGIELFTEGGAVQAKSIAVHPLKSIW
jgi:sucrose-6-phosphate hydrolase SacC (GH32 family)